MDFCSRRVKHKVSTKYKVGITKAVKRVIVVTLQKTEKMARILFGLMLIATVGFGQKQHKKQMVALQKHTYFLASDELQGRRAGDPGEQKAGEYIAEQFKKTDCCQRAQRDSFKPLPSTTEEW